MVIIEIHGGPINHRYLMKKSKDELASMYMRLLRDTEQDAKDAERYRWLREQSNLVAGMRGEGIGMACGNWSKDDQDKRTLDTAIDTAMKGANAGIKGSREAASP